MKDSVSRIVIPEHPELDKMEAVSEKSQVCGEFLEWLQEKGYIICEQDPESISGCYWPVRFFEKLLAEFFGIDLDKVEQEKRDILESARSQRQ